MFLPLFDIDLMLVVSRRIDCSYISLQPCLPLKYFDIVEVITGKSGFVVLYSLVKEIIFAELLSLIFNPAYSKNSF